MPTYEYECRTCGFVFERVQNMSDDPVRDCPECGQAVRRNIFGGSGVIFKGSGFYVNDSRGKNPAAPSGSKTNSGDSAGNAPSGTAAAGAASSSPDQKKPSSNSAGESRPSTATVAPAAPSTGASSQSGSKSSRD